MLCEADPGTREVLTVPHRVSFLPAQILLLGAPVSAETLREEPVGGVRVGYLSEESAL